jgi:hypothetical protein
MDKIGCSNLYCQLSAEDGSNEVTTTIEHLYIPTSEHLNIPVPTPAETVQCNTFEELR